MSLQTLFDLLPVVGHTAILYLVITLFLGFFGFRQTAELSIIELIVALMLGSAVETAMVAGNKSLLAGIVSVSTLLGMDRLFSALMSRWKWLRRLMVGQPKLLYCRGRYLEENIKKVGLTQEDVLEGFRHQGYSDPGRVLYAVFEVSGEITVVPKEESPADQGSDSKKKT